MTPEMNKGSDLLYFLLTSRRHRDLLPEHLEDLRKSGIRRQQIRSVSAEKIKTLLGFTIAGIHSGMLIPFPDPRGGFMNHIRIKVFPPLKDRDGHSIKYLQPKGSGVRLFFPLATLDDALNSDSPLWLVEGEKKALAVAQLALPVVGFCGIDGWHRAGSAELAADFDHIHLDRRTVELLPDGDCQTNENVRRGAERLALALAKHGARPRLVVLPSG